jgi:hypothetical protein
VRDDDADLRKIGFGHRVIQFERRRRSDRRAVLVLPTPSSTR